MKKVLVWIVTIFMLSLPAVVTANPFSLLLLGVEGARALGIMSKSSRDNGSNAAINTIQKYVKRKMREIGHPITFGELYETKKINDNIVLTYIGTIDNKPMVFSIVVIHINDPDNIGILNYIATWDGVDGIKEYKKTTDTRKKLNNFYKEKANFDLGPPTTPSPDETVSNYANND